MGKSGEKLEKVTKSGEKWRKVAKGGKKWGKVGKREKKWEKVGKSGKIAILHHEIQSFRCYLMKLMYRHNIIIRLLNSYTVLGPRSLEPKNSVP